MHSYFIRCLVFLLCFSFPVFGNCRDQNSTFRVLLTSGEIQGRLIKTANDNEGIAFLGVPYAQPPLANLRFQLPRPISAWSGILQCREYKPACWQLHTSLDNINYTGIEDCLYLNVFVGRMCLGERKKCPVLYYVHGGGYDTDTPSAFPPEVLVDNYASQGLIMVTIQYRLNAFGFWSTGTKKAAGNYGMHDMIAGLRWVKENVDFFGGDSSQVTIMGHSSGGAAVSLLTVSPKTAGLFNRAIMMSGTSGTRELENDLDFYWALAEELKCAESWQRLVSKTHSSIVDCMRLVNEDLLGKTYLRLQAKFNFPTSPRNDGSDGLFPLPLADLMAKRRPIDSMMGTTIREDTYKPRPNETTDSSTISDLCSEIIDQGKYRNRKSIIYECQRHYALANLSEQNNTDFWISQAERLSSDYRFHAPCFREADSLRSRGAAVYLYSFDYSKNNSQSTTPFHSFDLTYVVGLHPFVFDDRDSQLQSIYAPLFADFAKSGNPTPRRKNSDLPHWARLRTPYGFNYYSVDLPRSQMKPKYHFDGVIFWNYVVPSLENRDDNAYRLGGQRQGLIDNEVSFHEESEAEHFWRRAFWVTLAILCLTGIIACLIFLLGLWRNCKKRRERERVWALETQNLLVTQTSTYKTFY